MQCPSCKAEVFHVGSGALKARTRMLVVRECALVIVCPECRADVQIGQLDDHSTATMERERQAIIGRAQLRDTAQLTTG